MRTPSAAVLCQCVKSLLCGLCHAVVSLFCVACRDIVTLFCVLFPGVAIALETFAEWVRRAFIESAVHGDDDMPPARGNFPRCGKVRESACFEQRGRG